MSKFPGIQKSTNRINYYKVSLEEISEIQKGEKRPSLLMHACCAPCSSFPLEFLEPIFDVTIYYNNSNIYPSSEYERRLNELKQFLANHHPNVKLIVPPYDNEGYTKKLEPLKDFPEGRERCFLCYTLRMNEAYGYAEEHHFDYFTTVMTISRQKDSQKLNEIGRQLSLKHPTVRYFFSDFKKNKGIDRTVEISKELGLYKQDYCGCKYSYEKRQKDKLETK